MDSTIRHYCTPAIWWHLFSSRLSYTPMEYRCADVPATVRHKSGASLSLPAWQCDFWCSCQETSITWRCNIPASARQWRSCSSSWSCFVSIVRLVLRERSCKLWTHLAVVLEFHQEWGTHNNMALNRSYLAWKWPHVWRDGTHCLHWDHLLLCPDCRQMNVF